MPKVTQRHRQGLNPTHGWVDETWGGLSGAHLLPQLAIHFLEQLH